MIRVALLCLTCLLLAADSTNKYDSIIVQFGESNGLAYQKLASEGSIEDFVWSSWGNADRFLLAKLNTLQHHSLAEFLIKIGNEPGYWSVASELKLSMPDNESINGYYFFFHEFWFQGERYLFVTYSHGFVLRGQEVGYETFRIFRYRTTTRKYEIRNKFEDTKFFKEVASRQKYRGMDDRMMYFYDWVGHPVEIQPAKYFVTVR
jgi:hypothetical protein